MQENHAFIQELINVISVKYPIIGYGISFITMIIGAFLPEIFMIDLDNVEIPKIFMQMFQLLIGAGGFVLAVLTFMKNRKNKK